MASLNSAAEAISAEAAKTLDVSAPEPTPATQMEAATWDQDLVERALLLTLVDAGQPDSLPQAWQAEPLIWIQGSTMTGLGDLHALGNGADKAEHELQTLRWVIEDQQREANDKVDPRGEAFTGAADDTRWFRHLLPSAWIGVLKANREWVASGGITLLLIIAAASAFARRPGHAALPVAAEPRRSSGRRHRRRHQRGLQPS